MGLEVWPYPSGGSGLRSVPGSPGHGGTVTGTRLHTDTKLSPDTLDPAPALGPGLTLPPPPRATLHHPGFQAPCLCAHLSASCPPGWQLTLALILPSTPAHVQMCLLSQSYPPSLPKPSALAHPIGPARPPVSVLGHCWMRQPLPQPSPTVQQHSCHVTFRARMLSQASGAAVSK